MLRVVNKLPKLWTRSRQAQWPPKLAALEFWGNGLKPSWIPTRRRQLTEGLKRMRTRMRMRTTTTTRSLRSGCRWRCRHLNKFPCATLWRY